MGKRYVLTTCVCLNIDLKYVYKSIYLGPELPDPCGYPSMVTSPDGQGVILLGCAQSRETLFELTRKKNGQFSWNILPQKIQNPRYGSIAMLVPDELTNCN